MKQLIVPPRIARLRLAPGHRARMKVLAWGEAKAGKSFFAAHFPSPKVVLACGDLGIAPYIDGSVDHLFEVHTKEDLVEAIEFTYANEDKLESLVVDPLTLAWEDWMEHFNEKFGGDIRGGQWKDVKAPWKLLMRKLMQSRLHVCCTAWVDDIEYSQAERAPGVKGPLEINAINRPKVEKRVPHLFDLMFEWKLERSNKQEPTGKHYCLLTGGRRPRSVAPEDLHVGKIWGPFDSKNPTNPWEAIVVPLMEKWSTGDAVEHMGQTPQDVREAKEAAKEFEKETQDSAVGAILVLIDQQKTLQDFKEAWDREIGPVVNELGEEHKKIVIEARDRKKEALG